MQRYKLLLLLLLAAWRPENASAFCGFYVAKADASLFNRASRVVLVRDRDRTVITMANDFRGDPREFAVVVPVPTFIEREQIHVTDMRYVDHLDAYTAPRLVEYFDEDPCRALIYELKASRAPMSASDKDERGQQLGVSVEATYTVGEYDIVILSAKQSDGLTTWLTENGYRIPRGAERVLGSYIKQGVRFFVAKVNLEEQSRLGFQTLRPLQVAYESPKFILPIRLGTVNADGAQDLLLYTLTRTGRVETSNYRTVKLPTDIEVPLFVKDEFADFYRDMFARQVEEENMRAVFLEYAWDMAWCDPCAADPLSRDELAELGVFWLDDAVHRSKGGAAQNAFVTRLHVRYDGAHFPEDLVLQETGDRTNFQGRYVLRHPWQGSGDCPALDDYRRQLRERQERQARTLASLTGWELSDIYERIDFAQGPSPEKSWWKKLWN